MEDAPDQWHVVRALLQQLFTVVGQYTCNDLRESVHEREAVELAAVVSGCINSADQAGIQATAQSLASRAWQQLAATQLPFWRECYVQAQLSAAILHGAAASKAAVPATADQAQASISTEPCDNSSCSHAASAMEALDLAIITGAPSEVVRPLLQLVEPLARASWQQQHGQTDNSAAEPSQTTDALYTFPCSQPTVAQQYLASAQAIRRVGHAGVTPASFKKAFWKTDTPVIIEGALEGWPATTKWCHIPWWVAEHGHRTIPVEVGRDRAQDWREAPMLLSQFMTQYMPQGGDSAAVEGGGAAEGGSGAQREGGEGSCADDDRTQIAYIAQHPLFDQLPSLVTDFQVPELCGPGGAQLMNAWIGTAGTVTPLHYDTYDNFLAQVAGYKYVRLYARSQTRFLYVVHDQDGHKAAGHSYTRSQRNISAVDVDNPDWDMHPDFSNAQYTDTVLGPGDMLFIPAQCWHYVRSLTPSISVNFWF